ncbi:MAG: ferrochelatase [Pseudomonadota bacterium]
MNGILLVNLGTPEAPTPAAVRRYLAEFLSDPRVVALPRWIWLPVLHGLVLRTRPAKSARKYAAIWTAEGSPLAVHTEKQKQLLQERLPDARVEHAMRYGSPSIESSLKRLSGCGRVLVLPLYPQYSRSATESVRDCLPAGVEFVESFHDHPAYIAALAALVRRHWDAHGRPEVLLMSFHGLPRREIERGDPYFRQCLETADLLARALDLQDERFRVGFQSRFGPAAWIEPYTSSLLLQLGAARTRRVDVVCPGFVADCLETLEEIGIEGRRTFAAAGGGEFNVLPCLNESPQWIEALAGIAADPHLPVRKGK